MIFDKKKWGYFVIFVFFIIVGSVFATHNNLYDKDIVKDKEEIKVDKKQFGVYIEKEDETGYQLMEETVMFPSNGYVLNEKKSYCVDEKEKLLEGLIDYNNGKVTITSGVTVFCYFYFDISGINILVSTDGVSNTVPTSGIYKTSVSCSSGNIEYDPYYQRLEIEEIKNGTNCTLVYTKDTSSYTLLSSIVQENATTTENGFRYSGKTPNNYVWFNNEMWRIIGLVPACITASSGICSTTTNLVKIIRNESIGGLAYDAKSSGYTGLWGSNTLYTLLNTYYYGKQNGIGTEYCYVYPDTSKAKCDYRETGISSSNIDYYGQMIEDIYWNIGSSTSSATPEKVYGTESTKVTTSKAHIGLMSGSDYGYAAIVSGYGTVLSSYGTSAITGTNWLYGQGYEWINIQYSSSTGYALYVKYDGVVSTGSSDHGYAVRPALYLDAGVYKISGSGTMADPYIIGM